MDGFEEMREQRRGGGLTGSTVSIIYVLHGLN
jgi:hypothetical protein